MAGKIIADTIQTEASFLQMNVSNTRVATMNSSGIYSSSGAKMIGTDGSIGNSTISGATITSSTVSGNLNFDSTGTTGFNTATANTVRVHTAGVEAVRVTSGGDVGIGGITPSGGSGFTASRRLLHVYSATGSGNAQIHLGGTSGTMLDHDDSNYTIATLRNLYGASDARALMQIQSGYMTFGTGTSYTEAMRIDASGSMQIGGTASPSGTQRIVTHANGANGVEHMLFNELRTSSATENYVRFYRNGSQVGTISNTLSATAYNTSSDYRLKQNIAPMTGALSKVAQLKPVTYKWKVDGSNGQGFIAHELQAVVPDCVTGQKDAVDDEGNPQYQGVDVSFLVATLTAAIQEQQAIISDLKARIEALEA